VSPFFYLARETPYRERHQSAKSWGRGGQSPHKHLLPTQTAFSSKAASHNACIGDSSIDLTTHAAMPALVECGTLCAPVPNWPGLQRPTTAILRLRGLPSLWASDQKVMSLTSE
jgi:hypothetical protein